VDFDSVIYVAGAETLAGSAISRVLRRQGHRAVISESCHPAELSERDAVEEFFAAYRPEFVFHAAGRCGGIRANQLWPADLCQDNLLATSHVLHAAHKFGVRRLLYLGSACCYPRSAPQPLREEFLFSGPLEATNEAYAAAKLAGIALCRAYRQQYGCEFLAGIATNVYGPGDDFGPQSGHVIASLMARIHDAAQQEEPSVSIWGTGRPVREFLYVDDLAEACLYVMQAEANVELINLAGGTSLSIADLARRICEVVGYRGELTFDASQPDGIPLKSLDGSKLASLGWRPKTGFDRGLAATYRWYQAHSRRLAHVG
jgi:GDP-L-fucose synthase